MARWKNITPASIPDTLVPENHPNKVSMQWTIEFLTPMFGGGVHIDPQSPHIKNHDKVSPMRVSAIKGQLRFWWRAIFGCREQSIEEMRKKESEIWGSTGMRSDVVISVDDSKLKYSKKDVFKIESKEGRNKLIVIEKNYAYAVFPLQPSEKALRQNPVIPGALHHFSGNAKLTITCSKQNKDEVERTVETWLAFGGLGGRTRRGFGALSGGKWNLRQVLDGLQVEEPIQTLPGVPNLLNYRMLKMKKIFSDANEAHQELIHTLQDFRQGENTGRNPGAHPNRPGRSRWPEADAIRRLHKNRINRIEKFPRGQFGMPIIFHFKDKEDPQDTTLLPKDHERLASQLILRPYKLNNQYIAIALVLHSTDYENENPICLKSKTTSYDVSIHLESSESNFQPLGGNNDPIDAYLQKYFDYR